MAKIEMFTFCDFAQEVKGKLTIVGTFNEIKSKTFPFVYDKPFTLVARLNYKESLEKEEAKIKIIDPIGGVVEEVKVDYPVKCEGVKSCNINFLLNMNQMKFEMEGTYRVMISTSDFSDEIELYLGQI